MARPNLAHLVALGLCGLALAPTRLAKSAECLAPAAVDVSKECYAKVGPLLQSADGKLTPEVRNAYLDWAEATVVQQLRQSNQAVPDTCLAEVRRDATVRDALFGSVFPPDPSILQNYAQLRSQLGEKFLARYRSLVVAVSVAKRIKGVEKDGALKTIGRDYQDGFWVDESLQVPGADADKKFARCLADFMKQSQVSAADLYQNATLQAQLKAYLAQQSFPANWVALVNRSAAFGERLKYAMVLLGQRPAAREVKPSTLDWLRHLATIHAATPSSTPTQDGKAMPWPLFPLDAAPWPLLMPLAHPIPLSEANYVWEAFQGEHGPDRYHTYGPYRGDDDVIPDSLRPSQWFWDAWPDRIVHGGMCVPISKGTVDLYSALGKPAMWAGQPGHANLISFQYVGGAWTAEIEQAFAGGPDVTCAQWYFDEDAGTQVRFRDLYNWAGAEYHLGLAIGMNAGLKSYMDTRLAANIFRNLPDGEKQTLGVKLLRNTLSVNPYNPEIWYRLAEQTQDAGQELALTEAALKGDASLLSDRFGKAYAAKYDEGTAHAQYWHTLTQFLTQYYLLPHAAPQSEEDMHRAYRFLKTAPGVSASDLGTYAEKFAANRPTVQPANALEYDQKLAGAGDVYGLWRMGMRYRDGEGVPQSDARAKEFLARSAGQGDVASAIMLANLVPSIPADLITVTASSVYSPGQAARHLVDGVGMRGVIHDNEPDAKTMWHTTQQSALKPSKGGPAWVRFNFAHPMKFDSILIWNINQPKLTDRGFRMTRLFGSTDGATWVPLTGTKGIELPRASGTPFELPVIVPNEAAEQPFKAVLIAADAAAGNYGSDYYGLSAVRFTVHPLPNVVPAKAIIVTASSTYSPLQVAQHLIDGSGMLGALHDNEEAAKTMWHTPERPAAQPPVPGLAASPAWVRFDFAQPQQIDEVLIWNHNQATLTDRGLRKVRIYGSSDGTTWRTLTSSPTTELPRASGLPLSEPTTISISPSERTLKSVIIAAEETDGNYGGSSFGLSAVRFVARH